MQAKALDVVDQIVSAGDRAKQLIDLSCVTGCIRFGSHWVPTGIIR
jgi:hypothetical protein